MTTQTADTQEGQTPTPDNQDELAGRTPTENILGSEATGNDDAAVDSADTEDALMAGWKRTGNATTSSGRVRPKDDGDDGEVDITDVVLKNGANEDDGTDTDGDTEGAAANATTDTGADADPEIAGLGMKASQVKAQLAELETLKKTSASLAGSLGHLKQLVTKAGQGKEVTAEAFTNVANEFGPEFAAALANDLKSAGFGAGGSVDSAAISQMVSEQVEAAAEASRRKVETKAVLRAHKDANDHFAVPKLDDTGKPVMRTVKADNGQDMQVPEMQAGPKHAAFMQFLGTLPAERQRELQENGWDSDVVIRALDDFKQHEKKAATTQATQANRVSRAVAPRSGGAAPTQPAVDPMEQGWKNVKGRQAGRAASGARR